VGATSARRETAPNYQLFLRPYLRFRLGARWQAIPAHKRQSDERRYSYPKFPVSELAKLHAFAHSGAGLAADAQEFACTNNFLKFFFICA
jgi:hypothetical protein